MVFVAPQGVGIVVEVPARAVDVSTSIQVPAAFGAVHFRPPIA
jgi:hypothetical protein